MYPFLTLSLIFIAVLTYHLRKSDRAQEEVDHAFWEREQRANHTPKKDIESLDYIIIPSEKFPTILSSDSEKTLQELAGKRMIDFTDMTNTDLKLEYGTANITILTEYETDYVTCLTTLPVYCKELEDAGYLSESDELKEYARSIGFHLP